MNEKSTQPRRLNGWLRIGIMLSVLWFVGTFVYQFKESADTADLFQSTCIESARKTFDQCWEENRPFREFVSLEWAGKVLALALATIAFGWFCVAVVVGTVRWIMRGFSSQK